MTPIPMSFGGQEFADVALGDARRTRRLVRLADACLTSPDQSLPDMCHDPAAYQAALRLFRHPAVLAPHQARPRPGRAPHRPRRPRHHRTGGGPGDSGGGRVGAGAVGHAGADGPGNPGVRESHPGDAAAPTQPPRGLPAGADRGVGGAGVGAEPAGRGGAGGVSAAHVGGRGGGGRPAAGGGVVPEAWVVERNVCGYRAW